MLALNSFPGVICGHVEDPVDAYIRHTNKKKVRETRGEISVVCLIWMGDARRHKSLFWFGQREDPTSSRGDEIYINYI